MKKKDNMPTWVYFMLLGTNSKKSAIINIIIMFIVSMFLLIPQSVLPTIFDYTIPGVILLIILIPLWLAIRWVDKNSTWV